MTLIYRSQRRVREKLFRDVGQMNVGLKLSKRSYLNEGSRSITHALQKKEGLIQSAQSLKRFFYFKGKSDEVSSCKDGV